ncbi:MAG: lysine transporter LysE [Anaerolineae bacterium]|nr:MAG: lysine transporter LysE [Anaerolineae bacterium]
MTPFLNGVLAGLGIAIPVGAIGVLILETAMRRGLRYGLAAGAGAASADFLFALLAALAGTALAAALSPYATALRIASAWVLVGIGLHGLWRAGSAVVRDASAAQGSPWRIYGQFLALTLLNPMTIAYFAALILGQGAEGLDSPAARLAFVAGAGLASLAWQSFLAGLGAWAHRRLPPGAQRAAGWLGALIVLGLGIRMFF